MASARTCACPRRDRHTAVRHRRDGQDGICPGRDGHPTARPPQVPVPAGTGT
ncbi:hypothetical protein L514_0757 [Bordetella bronchiseptica MBORD635]|nr:hypothetical protein L509_0784 [Bordetella bronchiseptica M85/00/2]KDC73229.1 hypothetical protein L513_0760 [Bordetella bronchiseptica MBORD632]KDC79677.1 hypothetical protein L514_0757 [Bordetella bronchiseptica MBORD635]KDC88295.1 hypothetical protein L515_0866 [Bordetella bronchiseptica MBORD665]KDC89949.1 hypothetical protein L516_0792 [Bordetella bronchiseptica MBORD668]KDD00390.1 hypothetical protein L517_0767 [Bordetella bronchiseptica MBORD670]KDD26599.1 hypothetical protein L526_